MALQTVGEVIKCSLKRSLDFAARWGGEEFIVLLPATDATGAVRIAEKIRTNIEDTVIPCADESRTKVTVSIGVNTQIPSTNSSVSNFISIADSALYKAKEAGRNRVALGKDDIKQQLTCQCEQ